MSHTFYPRSLPHDSFLVMAGGVCGAGDRCLEGPGSAWDELQAVVRAGKGSEAIIWQNERHHCLNGWTDGKPQQKYRNNRKTRFQKQKFPWMTWLLSQRTVLLSNALGILGALHAFDLQYFPFTIGFAWCKSVGSGGTSVHIPSSVLGLEKCILGTWMNGNNLDHRTEGNTVF